MRIMKLLMVLCFSVTISAGFSSICPSGVNAEVPVLVNEDFKSFYKWDNKEYNTKFDATTWNEASDSTPKDWTWKNALNGVILYDIAQKVFGATDVGNSSDIPDSWDGIERGFNTKDRAIILYDKGSISLEFVCYEEGNYDISFVYGMRGWAKYMKDNVVGGVTDTTAPKNWSEALFFVRLPDPDNDEVPLFTFRRSAVDVFKEKQFLDFSFDEASDHHTYGSCGPETILKVYHSVQHLTPNTYTITFSRNQDERKMSSTENRVSTDLVYLTNFWVGPPYETKMQAYRGNIQLVDANYIFYIIDKMVDIVNQWTLYNIQSDGSLIKATDEGDYVDLRFLIHDGLEYLQKPNLNSNPKYESIRMGLVSIENGLSISDTKTYRDNKYLVSKTADLFNNIWRILQDATPNKYSCSAFENIGALNTKPIKVGGNYQCE